jgi:hypothetical protein
LCLPAHPVSTLEPLHRVLNEPGQYLYLRNSAVNSAKHCETLRNTARKGKKPVYRQVAINTEKEIRVIRVAGGISVISVLKKRPCKLMKNEQ